MLTVLGSRYLKSLTGFVSCGELRHISYSHQYTLATCRYAQLRREKRIDYLLLQCAYCKTLARHEYSFQIIDTFPAMGITKCSDLFFSTLPTAQTAIWSCNVHSPNRSALGLMIENFHIHHTIGVHPFPSSVSYNHPNFGN